MDWFLQLPTEVQLAVLGIVGSVVTMLGVMVRGHFVRNPTRENDYKKPPQEIRLSEEDRQLFREFRETFRDHGDEVKGLKDEIRMLVILGRLRVAEEVVPRPGE